MSPKRTIRDIRIPSKKSSSPKTSSSPARKRSKEDVAHESTPRTNARPPQRGNGRSSNTSYYMWLVTCVIIAVAVISFMNIFHRTTITLSVAQEYFTDIDQNIAVATEPAQNRLRVDTIVLQGEREDTVDAATPQNISDKAEGTIMIYNEETTPQRFVEETRFETPDGLIFMLGTGEGITVPAMSNGEPGSVEVTVYAEEAGEDYNIGLTDFVIPGWRESNNPKFATQYARSTSPMTGGFEGIRYVVDENGSSNAYDGITAILKDELRNDLLREVPQSHIVFDESFTYQDMQAFIEEGEDGASAQITLRGQGGYYIFDRELLSEFLARQLDTDFEASALIVDDWDTVDMAWGEEPVPVDFENRNRAFEIRLAGDVSFSYNIDIDMLRQELRNLSRREARDLLDTYEGVTSYEMSMRPFWKLRIPQTSARLDIVVESA